MCRLHLPKREDTETDQLTLTERGAQARDNEAKVSYKANSKHQKSSQNIEPPVTATVW